MVVMEPAKRSAPGTNYKSTSLDEVGGDGRAQQREELPKEVLVIAQEVKIVRSLACNDVNKRNRQIRKLRKWLQLRAQSSFPFTPEDFSRIWKGLYYNMWMSDKPLVQEELAEQIGQLLQCFGGNIEMSVNFFGSFLQIMCTEWFGVDQWRIDKFLMLVRRMLRYMFRVLRQADWSLEAIERFNQNTMETVLAETVTAKGLTMHYMDIFLEELAKVSEGAIGAEAVGAFMKPFIAFLVTQRDYGLVGHCRTRVFYHLLYQSGLGREYLEKYNAWKSMGFPTASINDLEKIEGASASDSEEVDVEEDAKPKSQKPLDPRAGNVDVFVPELQLDAKYIIAELEPLLYKRECSTKCRKMLKRLLEIFRTYQRGEFPLGVKTMPRFTKKSKTPLIREKIEQLEKLENEMYGIGRKLKQLNKRKRRKLLKTINFDDVDENNFERAIEEALPKDYLQQRKKRTKHAMMDGWLEEELTEEDVSTQTLNKTRVKQKKAKPISIKKRNRKHGHKLVAATNGEEGRSEPARKLKKLDSLKEDVSNEVEKPEDTANHGITEDKSDSIDIPAKDSVEEKPKGPEEEKKSESESESKNTKSEWDKPLDEGEVEYFLPSRKLKLKKVNTSLVRNPLAHRASMHFTPMGAKSSAAAADSKSASVKRVKIALKNNTCQNPSEYIRQIRSSPNVPYDASKKPGKGLLKPNAMPSPINPFYKKKLGLSLLSDTI